jgi:hypothetical protein
MVLLRDKTTAGDKIQICSAPPKNMIQYRIEINIMLQYSPKKNIAKGREE